MPEDRWSALFGILFGGLEDLDVVAMQEVTQESWDILLQVDQVQRDWVVVDCMYAYPSFHPISHSPAVPSVIGRSDSWYGTTMLVRKRWLVVNGFENLTAVLVRYPTSLGRSLLALEISDTQGIAVSLNTSNHLIMGGTTKYYPASHRHFPL